MPKFSRIGTGRKEERKFNGKTFYQYTWMGTKALASTRAKRLRSLGYNVRVIKSDSMGQRGWLIYTSGSKARR